MQIEVFLTASQLTREDLKGRTVVVVDVYRAASTIVTALAQGARAVVPVADMAEAGKIAANLDSSSYLLGGERGGTAIEGYHLGNSPLEYSEAVVTGKTIILNTTNGTGALVQAIEAEHLVVGCFLNAQRITNYVQALGLDLAIVCVGNGNRVSLEDTLCAGLLLHNLWKGEEPGHVSDAAHIAFTQYQQDRSHLRRTLQRCNNAIRLKQLGFEADVAYCLQLDALPVLPFYQDSRLLLKNEMS